jgi:uncharacterized protein YkwD
MKRLGATIIVLAALVPMSSAVAAPDVISQPLVALRSANRVGNAVQTEPPPAPTPTAPPTPAVSAELQLVLDLVNAERVPRGLVPLQFSGELNEAALAHTQRQASDGTIYHQDPQNGSSPGDRVSLTGYEFSTWGENVAAGYPTPAAVMQGWMNSEGHCKNILNPAFTEIGVGYVTGGARYNQFWTQVFARPRGVDRPAGTFNPAWC